MAFNFQTFKTRALTALVFVALMMAGLLYNEWSFFLLFTVVHFGAWQEYQRLVTAFNPDYGAISAGHRYGIQLASWCLMLYFTNDRLQLGGFPLTEAGFWGGLVLLIVLPIVMLAATRKGLVRNSLFSLVGLLYIGLPLGLLIDLRTGWTEEKASLGLTLPLLIIFSIWINDTMAYLVGSFIGKTPLSSISPKKTWEGTTGGVVLTVLAIGALAWATGRLPVAHAAVLAAIAGVSGTFGDLFESKLKRMAGVKDSGSFMPGHGGFLDRFDSLLFAATCCWFYARLFF
jgi:phosphatidate cytidylyltransferase